MFGELTNLKMHMHKWDFRSTVFLYVNGDVNVSSKCMHAIMIIEMTAINGRLHFGMNPCVNYARICVIP